MPNAFKNKAFDEMGNSEQLTNVNANAATNANAADVIGDGQVAAGAADVNTTKAGDVSGAQTQTDPAVSTTVAQTDPAVAVNQTDPAVAVDPAAGAGVDPFAAMGGGTNVSGQWIPNNNPAAIAAAKAAAAGQGTTAAGTTAAGTTAATGTLTGQAALDDAANKQMLKALMNGDKIDMNNPAILQAQGAYGAAQERSRRNSIDQAAEGQAAGGMGSSGAMDNERRMANEKAAQDTAGFTGQLAMGELKNNRDQLAQALETATRMGMADKANQLQLKLAQMDQTIKEKSLAQSGALGQGDINLRTLQTMLQNKQFGQKLGSDIGYNQAQLNNEATKMLMGG